MCSMQEKQVLRKKRFSGGIYNLGCVWYCGSCCGCGLKKLFYKKYF